jgi:VWFA-related protein
MRERVVILPAVTAGLAAIALVIAATGSQDRPPQERPLRHDAAAVVKLVPIRVLGPDGRPVTDLRKEDFTLLEDGQKKTITEFEVHALTEAGMTVIPELPPGTGAAARASGAMNRKFFFFLDQQGSDQAGKMKAKAAALHFLDTQVRPGDQVAVIGFYSMSGFYIREYLTSDLKRIRKAIEGPMEIRPSAGEIVGGSDDGVNPVEKTPPENNPLPPGLAFYMAGGGAALVTIPPGASGEGSLEIAPGTARFQRVDFVPRMEDLVEVFKTIPGTKSLVLFTARDMGPDAERLGRLFGAAGTAVYAVNTQDWKMGPFGTKFKFIWTDHSLKDLSAASGGRYFADINDTAGIAGDVQDLTGHYYVLGYYVSETWEGKYHKIRVEVARPGARVLVQDGYFDPKPFAQMSDFEKDVQLLDLTWSDEPAANPLPLAVDALVVEVGKTARACFLARWDVGARTGVPASRVEIYALLRDEAGTPLVSRKWEADLAPYAGKALFPYLSAPVSVGTGELRLVVRDRETGEAAVGRARFVVVPAPEAGLVLGSPLLFEPGPEAAFLRLPTKKDAAGKAKPGADGTSLMDLYGLIPKAGHPVVGETAAGAHRLAVILPYELRPRTPGEEPILGLEAKLIAAADKREVPLEVVVREHRAYEGRPDILIGDISFPDLAPGAYEIEITLEEIGTGLRASVRKPLTVR